ncbi:MAG: OsmC family protein [Candidatus Thermoplasmatota archaeon]|nr:OsmC family protein [Candidatus Thermoplasmatota archaeon]
MTYSISFHYEKNVGLKSDSEEMETVYLRDPITNNPNVYTPTETMLFAMSGCSSYDVLLIISRMRKEIKSFSVKVDAEREEEEPRVLKSANFTYSIDSDISEEQALRAINLSLEKYCSVTILARRGGVKVTYSLVLNGKEICDRKDPKID